MSVVSIISFLICIGFLASGLRRDADALAPARVFGVIWSFAFAVTNLKLSALQHEWPLDVWIQVLAGPLCFLAGLYVVAAVTVNQPLLSINEVRTRWRLQVIDTRKLFRVIIVLAVLYVVGYLIILSIAGEIPLFSAHPGRVTRRFTLFGIGLFLHHVAPIVILVVLYHLVRPGKAASKWLLKAIAAMAVIMYGIILARFQIMFTAIVCVSLLYYTTRHIRLKTAAIYFVSAVAFFYWVSTFRWGYLVNYYLYRVSRMKFSAEYALLTEPYMYLVMNLENLARSIHRIDFFTFGYYTFDFVTALGGIKHMLKEYFLLEETPFLISGYNTYTAFWTFYQDFGVFGVTIFPLIAGIAVGLLYRKLRGSPSIETLVYYSITVFLMLFSFFNSQFGFLWFVYNIWLLWIIFRYIQRQEPDGRTVVRSTLYPAGQPM